MGLKGGILWTARVPPLSCEQAQNGGVSVKKSEQKNSDGVEGGGGGLGEKWCCSLHSPFSAFFLRSPFRASLHYLNERNERKSEKFFLTDQTCRVMQLPKHI